MTAMYANDEQLAPGAPDPLPRNPWAVLFSPYTWLAVIHVVTSLVLCVPIFVAGILFLVHMAISSALNTIFLAALYQYAAEDRVPKGFDRHVMETAFTPAKA